MEITKTSRPQESIGKKSRISKVLVKLLQKLAGCGTESHHNYKKDSLKIRLSFCYGGQFCVSHKTVTCVTSYFILVTFINYVFKKHIVIFIKAFCELFFTYKFKNRFVFICQYGIY